MKTILVLGVLLLGACSFAPKTPISLVEIAKINLIDLNNPEAAKKNLRKAIETEDSIEARTLLAQILLHEDFANRTKLLPLVEPYIEQNAEAALIYGLIHYPNNDDASFQDFKIAAQMGHPVAMLYTASHYHHILDEDSPAVEWAMKAVDHGCANADDYVYLMDLSSLEKQEMMENFRVHLADYDNGLSQVSMMASGKIDGQMDEFHYWKRRALQTKERHEQRARLGFYDLNKECQSPFTQETFNFFSKQ